MAPTQDAPVIRFNAETGAHALCFKWRWRLWALEWLRDNRDDIQALGDSGDISRRLAHALFNYGVETVAQMAELEDRERQYIIGGRGPSPQPSFRPADALRRVSAPSPQPSGGFFVTHAILHVSSLNRRCPILLHSVPDPATILCKISLIDGGTRFASTLVIVTDVIGWQLGAALLLPRGVRSEKTRSQDFGTCSSVLGPVGARLTSSSRNP